MMEKLRHRWPVKTRREFFASAGSGLAGIALANMLSQDNLLGATRPEDPMAPKKPHHEPKCEERHLAVHEYRRDSARPSVDGRVGHLRAGKREPKSTSVRGAR
jgi:hypothetical protein